MCATCALLPYGLPLEQGAGVVAPQVGAPLGAATGSPAARPAWVVGMAEQVAADCVIESREVAAEAGRMLVAAAASAVVRERACGVEKGDAEKWCGSTGEERLAYNCRGETLVGNCRRHRSSEGATVHNGQDHSCHGGLGVRRLAVHRPAVHHRVESSMHASLHASLGGNGGLGHHIGRRIGHRIDHCLSLYRQAAAS